jgi:hypothetical protein
MSKNKRTIIVALAVVMLLGFATSASAYTEWWGCDTAHFFQPPSLVYKADHWTLPVTYTLLGAGVDDESYIEDITSGQTDVFNGEHFDWYGVYTAWVCFPDVEYSDTLFIWGASYLNNSKFTGTKPKGTVSIVSGSGDWYGLVRRTGFPGDGEQFSCGGAWTGSFNYINSPPTVSGNLTITFPTRLALPPPGYTDWWAKRTYFSP